MASIHSPELTNNTPLALSGGPLQTDMYTTGITRNWVGDGWWWLVSLMNETKNGMCDRFQFIYVNFLFDCIFLYY